MQKRIITTLSAILITGCANISPKTSSHKRYSYKSKSPSSVINNYKYESQRRELDQVIDNENAEKPSFLRIVKNDKVKFWLKYFSEKDKARFERFVKNGEKYKKIIEETFEDYGLPKELYYVGLIESGYYLEAKSHAGAVGPWQFIKDTAKRYGLTVRPGIDERRNIVKSTQAAALFFQDLYNIFGSWELALSAYNAGEYGVIRRIRGADTRDYYELSDKKVLPKETRHYVPKVIAAMLIYQNPREYSLNIQKSKIDIYENTKEIELKRSIQIDTLAKNTGVDINAIKKLNPDLYWRTIPYVRGGYKIILPNKNYQNLAHINKPEKRKLISKKSYNRYHKIRSGDNLISIAKKYGTNVSTIKRINGLKSSKIFIGQKIKIPGNSEERYAYRVRKGDNLYNIARNNHTTITQLVRENNLKRKTIYVGQRLYIPMKNQGHYTVRKGDYLLKIAKKHGMTVSKLKRMNGIDKSKIYPGQKLIVEN